MCGIAGIYSYQEHSPPVDQAELIRIREQMVSRGPDGAGVWFSDDQRVGLAHRRLAIIDPSPAGAQPMQDPETGNWIVFNGEIYNHVALRAQLNLEGVANLTHSDTEVLLKLYAQQGMGMLKMLRGMYAFAIWDAAKRQMFLARDPFGIKPLYIADDGLTLRFASQVKALLAGQVDTRPEPAGHVGFLLWGSVPGPYTLYRGIRSLPPGHWICVADGVVGHSVCFSNPAKTLRKTTSVGAEDEAATLSKIAKAVRDSVAAHMVADVPVGVFLSAGLDSTMLAACAADTGQLQTLTLGFEEYKDGIFDEAALAGEVAQTLGAEHTLHRISAADFAHDRALMLAAMDQPSIDGINTWFIAKAAAKQGLKVVLSGIGGDELFGSYSSFSQVPRLQKTMKKFSGVPFLNTMVRKGLSSISGILPSPKYAGLLEYGGTLEGAYLLRRALFMPWEISALMDPEMAAEGLKALDTLATMRTITDGISSERLAVSALEMQMYMKNQLLRDADWAGMAHSVEIRTPLVDMVLLENFVEITSLSPLQEKQAVARAVAPNLPEAVLARPKTGFSVPIHQWLNPDSSSKISSHREWAKLLYQTFTKVA